MALDPYYKQAYEYLMKQLREEGARLKAGAEKSYMGRGFAGSSGWERRLAGIDQSIIGAGQKIVERLALEQAQQAELKAEREKERQQASKQGWGRVIGTGLGMVAGNFIPGVGTAVGMGLGGSLGGMLGGQVAGSGAGGGMYGGGYGAYMQDPYYQMLVEQLRQTYGVTQPSKVEEPQPQQPYYQGQGPTYDPEWWKRLGIQGPSPYFLPHWR